MSEAINLLEQAVFSEDWEVVEAGLRNGININDLDDEGNSLLSCAVYSDNIKSVQRVIELGADVNIKLGVNFNVLGYVALLFAQKALGKGEIHEVDPEIISFLIQAGSDMRDAMIIGIRSGSVEFIDMLFKNGADINGKFAYDQTPLALAMLNANHEIFPSIIKYLAEKGAYLDEIFMLSDGIKTTALNICVSNERSDILEILLEYGADPDVQDATGRTALTYSVLVSNELLNILLEYGADPNLQDNNGRTPLMLAVIDGTIDFEIIDSLIEFGADVNAQDKLGMTSLMWVIAGQDRSPALMISALIRTGGFHSENFGAWVGLAAIYAVARREVQLEIICRLLKCGADVNIKNVNGMTALSYAKLTFDGKIIEMLKNAGAKR